MSLKIYTWIILMLYLSFYKSVFYAHIRHKSTYLDCSNAPKHDLKEPERIERIASKVIR